MESEDSYSSQESDSDFSDEASLADSEVTQPHDSEDSSGADSTDASESDDEQNRIQDANMDSEDSYSSQECDTEFPEQASLADCEGTLPYDSEDSSGADSTDASEFDDEQHRIMMFAGSAITQGPNVGRIDQWSLWRPTTRQPLWLLLSGATDPPKNIDISERRTRDAPGDSRGTFLAGVTRDLLNMEDVVGASYTLFNTVKDLYLKKSAALRHIRSLFDECKRNGAKPMLYYTGHGEVGTGDWCFDDGTISLQEILDMVPSKGMSYPMIFSDACYSGHWADFCISKGIAGFHCLAACPHYSIAFDTPGKGGDLTLFMTGKKPRPSTEPIYSGGNLHDFPINAEFDTIGYNDFVSSLIKNSQRILISQDMHNGYFSGCFATSELHSTRPSITWGLRRNHDSFLELVKRNRKKSKRIYSLACDERFGFGVFLMERYGTRQSIVTDTSDIQKFVDDGFNITACAARGSTFFIIMTKNTKEYKGKRQTWFTGRTWNEVENKMKKRQKNGKAITGICYSAGLRKYFVVMTKMPARQDYKWRGNTKEDRLALSKWVGERYKKGYHPTIIFHDPTDNQILIVMTKDKNRCDFQYRLNYKMVY